MAEKNFRVRKGLTVGTTKQMLFDADLGKLTIGNDLTTRIDETLRDEALIHLITNNDDSDADGVVSYDMIIERQMGDADSVNSGPVLALFSTNTAGSGSGGSSMLDDTNIGQILWRAETHNATDANFGQIRVNIQDSDNSSRDAKMFFRVQKANSMTEMLAINGEDGNVVVSNGGLKIGSGAAVTTILDEDDMASNSATALATQQSIKAYVASQVGAAGGGDITGVDLTGGTGVTIGSETGTTSGDYSSTISIGQAVGTSDDVTFSTVTIASDLIHSGDTNNNIGFGTDTQTFTTAGSARMFIDTDGEVGIGTTSPTASFDVSQGGAMTIIGGADLGATTRTNDTRKFFRMGMPHYHNAEEPFNLLCGDSSGTQNKVIIGGGTSIGNAATDIVFNTAANDATTTGTTRMQIKSDGKVGIGTTSPSGILHVKGASTINTIANSARMIVAANGGDSYIHLMESTDGHNIRHTASDNSLRFRSTLAGSDLMALTSGGSLGIGTTSPSTKLDVSGSVTLTGLVLDGNTITGVDDSEEFTNDDAHIMTSAAIEDKILSYGYTTNTGDITGVDLTGGTGVTIGSETNTGSGAYSSTISIGQAVATSDDVTFSTVTIASELIHSGDTNNKIGFGTDTQAFTVNGNAIMGISDGQVTVDGSVTIKERASAPADNAGYGQLWVKSDGDGELYFTDDNGTDIQLTDDGAATGSGGGGAVSAVANGANNRIATFSSADALNGESALTWDGGTLSITSEDTVSEAIKVTITDTDGTADSTPFVVDGNGRVGIGTASPLTDMALTLNGDGTSYEGLAFQVGGSTKFKMSSDGSAMYFDSQVNTYNFNFRTRNSSGALRPTLGLEGDGFRTAIGYNGTSGSSLSPQNTLQVNVGTENGVQDKDDGLLLLNSDLSIADGDMIAGIGFATRDGNIPSVTTEAAAYIAAYAVEDHGTGDKGGYLTLGTSATDDDDDTTSHEVMRIMASKTSATDYLQVHNAVNVSTSTATEVFSGPKFEATGSSTHVGMQFKTKGRGQFTFINDFDDANHGPTMNFFRQNFGIADNDPIGVINFKSMDSNPSSDTGSEAGNYNMSRTYGRLRSFITDTSNGTVDGRMSMSTMVADSLTELFEVGVHQNSDDAAGCSLIRAQVLFKTGTSNSLSGITDAGRYIVCGSGSAACTLTLQASPAIGEQYVFISNTTGTVTIDSASGTDTINGSTNAVTITTKYNCLTCIALSANEWVAIG